jgi:hypothetical protein
MLPRLLAQASLPIRLVVVVENVTSKWLKPLACLSFESYSEETGYGADSRCSGTHCQRAQQRPDAKTAPGGGRFQRELCDSALRGTTTDRSGGCQHPHPDQERIRRAKPLGKQPQLSTKDALRIQLRKESRPTATPESRPSNNLPAHEASEGSGLPLLLGRIDSSSPSQTFPFRSLQRLYPWNLGSKPCRRCWGRTRHSSLQRSEWLWRLGRPPAPN